MNLTLPADWTLFFSPAIYRYDVYQMTPAPCRQDQERLPSILNKEKRGRDEPVSKGLSKLGREVKRSSSNVRNYLGSRAWKSAYETVDFA